MPKHAHTHTRTPTRYTPNKQPRTGNPVAQPPPPPLPHRSTEGLTESRATKASIHPLILQALRNKQPRSQMNSALPNDNLRMRKNYRYQNDTGVVRARGYVTRNACASHEG